MNKFIVVVKLEIDEDAVDDATLEHHIKAVVESSLHGVDVHVIDIDATEVDEF